MSEKFCVVCNERDPSRLLLSERGYICERCNLDAEPAPTPGVVTPMLLIGYVAGFLPCVFSFRQSSVSYVNGEIVTGWSFDYVAMTVGAFALIVSVLLLIQGIRTPERRGLRIGLAAGVLVLALVQLLRSVIPFF